MLHPTLPVHGVILASLDFKMQWTDSDKWIMPNTRVSILKFVGIPIRLTLEQNQMESFIWIITVDGGAVTVGWHL